MTPTTVAQVDKPPRTTAPRGGSQPYRKVVISPPALTLTASVVGIALIASGTGWTRLTGAIESATTAPAAEATATTGAVELATEAEAAAAETTVSGTWSREPVSPSPSRP